MRKKAAYKEVLEARDKNAKERKKDGWKFTKEKG